MASVSQEGQDRIILDLFFRENGEYKRGGIFIEVGAYDGVTISNTLLMERELGWTGLCLEPIPERFTQLRNNRNIYRK